MQCQKKVAAVLEYLIEQQPRKLTDIIVRLPRMGVGRQFTRTTWLIQDMNHQVQPAYWTITKVIPAKNMTRFKIWGEFCARDSSSAVRSVRSPEKYEWLLLPKNYSNDKLVIQSTITGTKPTSETTLNATSVTEETFDVEFSTEVIDATICSETAVDTSTTPAAATEATVDQVSATEATTNRMSDIEATDEVKGSSLLTSSTT